ncbi:MAG: hypothetical protein V1895_00795, partial [Parcubacteria group bacterium]
MWIPKTKIFIIALLTALIIVPNFASAVPTFGGEKQSTAPVKTGENPPGEEDSAWWKDKLTTLGLMSTFAELTDEAIDLKIFFSDSVNIAINTANIFILNLVNLFYILVLLVIAIATIFDWQPYAARSLLPKLVIAILLSNFGLFFVKSIADASQLLADGIAGNNGAEGLASAISGSISGWAVVKQIFFRALGIGAAIVTKGASVPLSFIYEAIQPTNWFVVAFMITTVVFWLRI